MEVGASACCSEAVAGLRTVGTSFQQGTDHQAEVARMVGLVLEVGQSLGTVGQSLEKAGPEEVGQILEKTDEAGQSQAGLPLFRHKDKADFRRANEQADLRLDLEQMIVGCNVPQLAEEIAVQASLAVHDKVVEEVVVLLAFAFRMRMVA